MRTRLFTLLGAATVAAVLVVSVAASSGSEGRRGPRILTLPTTHLAFRDGPAFLESMRGMQEAFPYVEVNPGAGLDARRGLDVTPKSLGGLLKKREGGRVVASPEAALEAVRLFVAGPLVKDRRTAERIIAKATEFEESFRHLPPEISDDRPASYEPVVRRLPTAGGEQEGWSVGLTALECDRMLRLVRVTATVRPSGAVKLERQLIVNGPMTVWQTAFVMDGQDAEVQAANDREMHAEAALAREGYLKALRPTRDAWTLWSLGRLVKKPSDVVAAFGKPDRTLGEAGGETAFAYRLPDGDWAQFGVRDKLIRTVEVLPEPVAPGEAHLARAIYFVSAR